MSLVVQKWNELAEVKAELAARDWFFATSGNLSIKVTNDPLTFLVTASGKDKRKQTDEDFLLVDGDGNPAEDTHLKPSAETLLHVEIYRRTKAGCVLHVHTVDNNLISDVYAQNGEAVFSGQEIIKAFGIWEENAAVRIPIIDNDADIPTLAAKFAKHVDGDTGAVLIHNHGITVWGRGAFEVKKHLEAWEFLFRWQVKRLLLQRAGLPVG